MKKYVFILAVTVVFLLLNEIGMFSSAYSLEQAIGLPLSASSVPFYNKSEMIKLQSDGNIKEFPDIYWLGHNGFYIAWGEKKILFDPHLSSTCKGIPRRSEIPISPEHLGSIDVVFISHAHYDHLDMETLKQLTDIGTIVVPASIGEYLDESIVQKPQILELKENETVDIQTLHVTAVFAKHNGSRFHPFSSSHRATGYVLSYKGVSIYLAGDTGYDDFFKSIRTRFNPDISILPIGSYEPYFVLKDYHLSPFDAVRAALDLSPSFVIPSHFGTFRLALDRTERALPLFKSYADNAKITWGVAPMISANVIRK